MDTPEELKAYLLSEIKRRNPELIPEFEQMWKAISKIVKTKAGVEGFLKGYGNSQVV